LGAVQFVCPPLKARRARSFTIGYEVGVSKLPHIQLLRGFAALSVVAFHAQSDAAIVAARLGKSFARSDAFPWLSGVDIFFVISGFIMVYATGRSFSSARASQGFLSHRIARIVPLYWGDHDCVSCGGALRTSASQQRISGAALRHRLLPLHSRNAPGRTRPAPLFARLNAEL
jgi:hypothetical protein